MSRYKLILSGEGMKDETLGRELFLLHDFIDQWCLKWGMFTAKLRQNYWNFLSPHHTIVS